SVPIGTDVELELRGAIALPFEVGDEVRAANRAVRGERAAAVELRRRRLDEERVDRLDRDAISLAQAEPCARPAGRAGGLLHAEDEEVESGGIEPERQVDFARAPSRLRDDGRDGDRAFENRTRVEAE